MSESGDWDPKSEEARSWYHHYQTGERGYVVHRSGKKMIRLDRPLQEIVRKLDDTWISEDATRPLTPAHIAKICFEADKALCHGLGLIDQSRADWAKLTDLQRSAWVTKGPVKPHQRALLFAGIKKLMEGASGG